MQANAGIPVLRASQSVLAPVQNPGTPLPELFKRYEAENTHTMKGNRSYDFRQAFDVLLQTLGPDVVAERIDKAHIRKVKDVLALLPVNARKNKQFKDMSYPEIAERNKELGLSIMSDRSRNRILGCLNQLMDWSVKEGFVTQNPVSGMLLKLPKEKSDRLPFDSDDLRKMFNAPIFIGRRSERAWKEPGALVIKDSDYWMPLLALLTGARANELLQLTKGNVLQEEGVWIIDIGGRVKTKGSIRKVPLHPELVPLGFIDWVTSLKIRPEDRLFREVKPASADGKFSTNYSKRFGRFLDSVGMNDDRKVFHSFRHLFTDLLRAKADEGVIKAILGHDDPSVTSRYGNGYPLSRLHDAVSAVVPPVDLSHLYPRTRKLAS
jgi:integrase